MLFWTSQALASYLDTFMQHTYKSNVDLNFLQEIHSETISNIYATDMFTYCFSNHSGSLPEGCMLGEKGLTNYERTHSLTLPLDASNHAFCFWDICPGDVCLHLRSQFWEIALEIINSKISRNNGPDPLENSQELTDLYVENSSTI